MRFVRDNDLGLFLLLGLVACGCIAHTKKQPGDIILPYPAANDSFLVRINDFSGDIASNDTIHLVYYVDGSLKSGKETEAMIMKRGQELLPKHYVFVGIAHLGAFRPRRRRDFIPPSVKTDQGYKAAGDDYGQADAFYDFLQHQIMPLAEKKLAGHIIKRSFVGHSLGGLFAVYLLMNGDTLFTDLYAQSPALWIDDYHLLDYESAHQGYLNSIQKNILISCGSRETLNRIKSGVNRIADTLDKRKYPGINYHVKIYEGETHNSSVGPALNDMFAAFSNSVVFPISELADACTLV